MKNKPQVVKFLRKSFALITAVILVFCLFSLAGCSNGETPDDEVLSIQKTVNFKIVYADGSQKTVELKTEKTTLAEALVEADLIEYNAGGLYTTIDGVTADYNVDGSWWCITKGGEMLNFGLNDLKIADGETYEATYTK